MDLKTITKKFIDEISHEIKKEDNIDVLKHDIFNPIIKHIIDELYPYFFKILVCILIIFIFIIITLFLNLRIVLHS